MFSTGSLSLHIASSQLSRNLAFTDQENQKAIFLQTRESKKWRRFGKKFQFYLFLERDETEIVYGRFYAQYEWEEGSLIVLQIYLLYNLSQGWAGMTFGSSGTGTGMDNSIPEVREREGNWKNPFPQFGNGKGMKKNHSQNSGMGREWKNLFPKFGNGKGMKKIHSHNSGMGIRGYHSQKYPGTGMKKLNMTIKEK